MTASLETRLARNRTELRLQNKASKRDVAASDARLIRIHERNAQTPASPFPYPDSHLKIANDHLSPTQAATRITDRFDLPLAPSR